MRGDREGYNWSFLAPTIDTLSAIRIGETDHSALAKSVNRSESLRLVPSVRGGDTRGAARSHDLTIPDRFDAILSFHGTRRIRSINFATCPRTRRSCRRRLREIGALLRRDARRRRTTGASLSRAGRRLNLIETFANYRQRARGKEDPLENPTAKELKRNWRIAWNPERPTFPTAGEDARAGT